MFTDYLFLCSDNSSLHFSFLEVKFTFFFFSWKKVLIQFGLIWNINKQQFGFENRELLESVINERLKYTDNLKTSQN